MKRGSNSKLPQKQEQCIAALLSEGSIRHAAHEAGVSDKTLRGYLKDPAFQAAYAAARREVLTLAIGRLQQGAGRAVTTLLKKLRSANDAVAVRAALGILAEAFRGADLLDIIPRLEALEAAREPVRQQGTAEAP
jgi:hypothetical protein